MDEIERMKELIHDLNRASDSYYGSGTTLMSDAEFDSKLLELKQLEEEANTVFPNSPVNRVGGAVLKSLIKVKHETPMLSLDKCHSVEEIKKFAAGHDIVASIKLDGISCRLIYQDGELIGAESRGNGTEGNDILQHVKQFMNVPLRINKKGKYVIDGEALIKLDDFEEMGDIILSTAAQQYGGFTVPEADKILEPYAEKSYRKYFDEFKDISFCVDSEFDNDLLNDIADKYATNKVHRDFEQGWQGIEYKLNSVSSSRGDYPFVTITIGLATSKFGKMAAITLLNVHKDGQGKKGFKRPVLFPKIVFLYDKELHGDGSDKYPSADVFNAGIDCSAKTMYPDWLSLTGDGYVAEMYKKYKKVVSPMGCRAFLSPWYERGGMHPADENDTPIFKGRFNLGVVSLHLPMILAKARRESKDFYEVLDYYLELVRGLHKRTYDYIGELHASVNPVAFCEGGFLGGHLNPDDKIKSILPPMTMSYGITALNELQRLYNGKSIREDGQFVLEVMQYINDYTNRIKEEDHILYAIYGTPAESLCGLQVEQFRKIYGIIENVSDKEYVSNSFHCHVSEDMNPIEKQDKEGRFWNLFNGGKIQYCRYNLGYNKQAIKTLVLRAMDKGFYEGVNLAMCYCEDCGYQQVEMDTCPKCGSKMITKIDRMNGYLGFTRVHGQTRYNEAKNAEIKDRVSM